MSRPGTVVCLHGFPDGPATFAPLTALLEAEGHRVSTPHLPGHSPATAPLFAKLRRSSGTLLAACELLVEDLLSRLAPPIHLVGHDWGAVLGFALLSRFPNILTTFTSLAIPPLLDPVGGLLDHPRTLLRFDYIAAFQLPRVGELLLSRPAFLRALTRRWSPTLELPDALTDDVDQRYADPTVRAEVLAYYRALLSPTELSSTWSLLRSPSPIPTLLIHGDSDGCFPAAVFPRATASLAAHTRRPVTRVQLPGVGHFPQLEAPAAVHAALRAHIGGH